jgi:hypothetical protein
MDGRRKRKQKARAAAQPKEVAAAAPALEDEKIPEVSLEDPISLEPLKPGDVVVLTSCGHTLSTESLMSLLNGPKPACACPVCREPILRPAKADDATWPSHADGYCPNYALSDALSALLEHRSYTAKAIADLVAKKAHVTQLQATLAEQIAKAEAAARASAASEAENKAKAARGEKAIAADLAGEKALTRQLQARLAEQAQNFCKQKEWMLGNLVQEKTRINVAEYALEKIQQKARIDVAMNSISFVAVWMVILGFYIRSDSCFKGSAQFGFIVPQVPESAPLDPSSPVVDACFLSPHEKRLTSEERSLATGNFQLRQMIASELLTSPNDHEKPLDAAPQVSFSEPRFYLPDKPLSQEGKNNSHSMHSYLPSLKPQKKSEVSFQVKETAEEKICASSISFGKVSGSKSEPTKKEKVRKRGRKNLLASKVFSPLLQKIERTTIYYFPAENVGKWCAQEAFKLHRNINISFDPNFWKEAFKIFIHVIYSDKIVQEKLMDAYKKQYQLLKSGARAHSSTPLSTICHRTSISSSIGSSMGPKAVGRWCAMLAFIDHDYHKITFDGDALTEISRNSNRQGWDKRKYQQSLRDGFDEQFLFFQGRLKQLLRENPYDLEDDIHSRLVVVGGLEVRPKDTEMAYLAKSEKTKDSSVEPAPQRADFFRKQGRERQVDEGAKTDLAQAQNVFGQK